MTLFTHSLRRTRPLHAVLMCLMCLLMPACTTPMDHLDVPASPSTSGSLTLHVGLPLPLPQQVGTRAVATDFDLLRDLNIVMASGTTDEATVSRIVYFTPDQVDNDGIVSLPGDGGKVTFLPTQDNDRQFELHFSREWFAAAGISSSSSFFLVGNYGRAITSVDVPTVGALRDLRDTDTSRPGWINPPAMLYGEATRSMDDHVHDGITGIQLEAKLLRTTAMMTVKIDGSNLAKGVVITPTEVSLHNVPVSCRLGTTPVSIPTSGSPAYTVNDLNQVASDGEYKTNKDLLWPSVASQSTIETPAIAERVGSIATTAGGHYTDTDSDDTVDYTNSDGNPRTDVHPLFMYENIHPAGFGATDVTPDNQWQKRPAGVATTASAIEAATKSCSYLEVKGLYQRYDDNGVITLGGSVSFRLFLGEDVLSNFDVQRNGYYCVTLQLSGNAVQEGGQIDSNGNLLNTKNEATWRVNTSLDKSVLMGDADIICGGNGEMVEIEFAGASNKQFKFEFLNSDGTTTTTPQWEPFVFVQEEKNSNKKEWYPISNFNGNVQVVEQNDKHLLHFYIQPMIRDFTWNENEHVRSITFRIHEANGGSYTDWITVTQYEPIVLHIDANSPDDVKDYAQNVLKAEPPVDIYIDRMDRKAQPWGFDGVLFEKNSNNGFDNVYDIISPSTPESAQAKAAKRYLPFGLAYWDDNNNQDFSKGSAMMHAAFMNSAQQWVSHDGTVSGSTQTYTLDALNGHISTSDLLQTTNLPLRPGSNLRPDTGGTYQQQNPALCFAWIVPSIAEWQLLEKMDKHMDGTLFDPAYPILSAFPYWTSNAGTSNMYGGTDHPKADGMTYAFTYQMNQGLDAVTKDDVYPDKYLVHRTQPMRYRLIAVKPSDIGWTTNP